MKFVLLTIASAKAFAPTTFVRSPSPLSANLVDTIAGLQGPEIYWGSEGIEQGFEEAEIRGYDNFGKLAEAIKGAGLADALNGGEFTLLAPSDSAIEKHINEVGTPIDADILKYHVIPGKISMTGLETDQVTLNGGTLTSYRKFRKYWLDNAVIGLKSEGASKSANWPADVACDNGMIHGIDTVLVPGAYTGSR